MSCLYYCTAVHATAGYSDRRQVAIDRVDYLYQLVVAHAGSEYKFRSNLSFDRECPLRANPVDHSTEDENREVNLYHECHTAKR